MGKQLLKLAVIYPSILNCTCAILTIAAPWLAQPLLPNLPLSSQPTLLLWLVITWACCFNPLTGLGKIFLQIEEQARQWVKLNLSPPSYCRKDWESQP